MADHDDQIIASEAADRLNEAWDELLRRGKRTGPRSVSHPGGPADTLLATAARLHQTDDAAAPDPVFVDRLWGTLIKSPPTTTVDRRDTKSVGLLPFGGMPSWVQLIAGAAMLVLLLGGQFSGHGPLSTLRSESPTVAAESVVRTPLGAVAGCTPVPLVGVVDVVTPAAPMEPRPTWASDADRLACTTRDD